MTAEHTTYALANMAECAGPDSNSSPGAEFLGHVADATAEWLERGDITDPSDAAHEIADGAVPIYTHEVWATFVDLAAYNEDPTELGTDGSDMEQAAKVCLYMIAERLANALLAEVSDDDDEDDDDGD